MPRSVPFHRRPLAWAAPVLIAVLALAGCTGQRDPGGYGDGVRRDFINGCSGSAYATEDQGRAPDVEMSREECGAIYNCIEDDVPFARFREANSKLRSEGGTLTEAFENPQARRAFERCVAGGGSPESTNS